MPDYSNIGQDAGTIGSDAATGASIGSVIPGVGTAAGAVAGGILGLGTSIYGFYQQKKAAELAANAQKNTGPTYQIPPEIQQNLSLAQQQALEGLPDEQKQQYINNLQRSTSFGLGAMNDRRAGLTGLGGIVGAQDQGYQSLLASDASARNANLATLMGARSNMADYRNAAFQTNQLNPFLRNDAYAKAQQGAGIQNVMGGANTIAHAIGAYRSPNTNNANNGWNNGSGMSNADLAVAGTTMPGYDSNLYGDQSSSGLSLGNADQGGGLGFGSGGMNNWLGM